MKVKSFFVPGPVVATVAQGRAILRGAWAIFRGNTFFALSILVGALSLGALVWPHDRQLLETVHWYCRGNANLARNVAWYLSTCGDYPTYNVPLALLIWLYGLATKNRTLRRVAVICFLGATLAGLFDDCFRLTLGRPRPDTHKPDGFYGITYAFSGGYQSFPSGHAASVFGTAFALLLADLPLGIITTIFACAVVWARMELERHYPSDVIVGMVIGIYFGVLVAMGARVHDRRRLAEAKKP